MKSALKVTRYLELIRQTVRLTHRLKYRIINFIDKHLTEHSSFKKKRSFAIVLLCFTMAANTYSQARTSGRIQFDMPLIAPENEQDITGGNMGFEIYAVSGSKARKFSYWSRILKPDSHDFVDRYVITVPMGRYSIRVRYFESYLLPRIVVRKGRVYSVTLPISRLAAESTTECSSGRMVSSKMTERERNSKHVSIRTQLINTGGPFDIAVHFCSSKQINNMHVFKSAKVYYRNYYIVADEVKVDQKERRLIAIKNYGGPLVYKNGLSEKVGGESWSISF